MVHQADLESFSRAKTVNFTTLAATAVSGWNTAFNVDDFTYTNANKTAERTLGSGTAYAVAAQGAATGKRYFELSLVTGVKAVGIADDGLGESSGGLRTDRIVWQGSSVFSDSPNKAMGTTVSNVTFTAIAFDADAKLVWFWQPNTQLWNNDAAADPAAGLGGLSFSQLSGVIYPMASLDSVGDQVTLMNKSSEWTLTPPTGFTALSD